LPNSSLIVEPAKILGMNSITKRDFFIRRRKRGSQGWESKNSEEECREISSGQKVQLKKVGPMRGRCTRPTKVGKHEAKLMVRLS
jgi:hypothetical protein